MKKERNGMDALNIIFAVIAAILIGITFPSRSIVPLILAGIFVIIFLFRALSSNLEKRRGENQVVLDFGHSVKSFWKLEGQKWRDRKHHVYKRCPKCHQVLRVKRVKGKKEIVCPHCGTPIHFTIHFKGEPPKEDQ